MERYSQVKPKLLFVDTNVRYAGKRLDLREKMSDAAERLHQRVPEFDRTIVVRGPAIHGTKV